MAKIIPFDGILVQRARQAVSAELKKKQALDQPIAVFDASDKMVYLVYSDGRKKPIGGAMRGGRYSEC